jgi:hypothetical protein
MPEAATATSSRALSRPGPGAGETRARSDAPTAAQNRVFFALTLAVFLVTRLWGLEKFPIFFFCDEAVQTVQAARLWTNGFRGEKKELFPTYFRNTDNFNQSVGVYLQVLPGRFLPRSVFVARAVPVVCLLSAMLAAGWILRDYLRLRYFWVGVLALSGFPGWFLFTRIAFEVMLATTAYVWFLFFYLRYRSGTPRSLFAAAVCGALTFYAYNTFQPVIAATAMLLGIVDAPFHWRNRRTVLGAVILVAVLAWPYVRFLRAYPEAVQSRLRSLDSYWTHPGRTLPEKLRLYGREYVRAFDPRYWFRPDPPGELVRHKMKGYAHAPLVALPLILGGVALCVRRIRSPGERTLLVALACAPVGAAIVRSQIPRSMSLLVVLGLLLGVGADPLLRWMGRRVRPVIVGALVAAGLAAAQGAMLADALRNGPTWYRDYGLYGLQWGARELLGEVAALRARHPKAHFVISPDWANGTGDLVEFFLGNRDRVQMASVGWLLYQKRDIPEQTLAVWTEPEYQLAAADPRFADLRIEKTIPFPDGRPGFQLVWVRYAPDFDRVLAEDRERWRRLVSGDAEIAGAKVAVAHSVFDIGRLKDLFDGDAKTLVRTESANPAVVVLNFDPPIPLREIALTLGTMYCEISVLASGPSGQATATETYRDFEPDPTRTVAVPPIGGPVSRLSISVRNLNSGEPGHIHLRDLRLR